MRTRHVLLGVLASVLFLALAGLVLAQTGERQLPSLEERLSAWTQAKGQERVPVSISFDRRLPDAQVEQLASRYDLRPYAVFMWSEGMFGAHRTQTSKAALSVLADARRETVGMKQKAQQSSRFRSQRFVQQNPQEKVTSDRALEQDAKSLLRLAEQNDKILSSARSGAPLIYAIEALGTPEQIRKLAQDPAVAAVESAVISEGRVAVPAPKAPAETQGEYRSSEIEALKAADAYNRVKQMAGTPVSGRTR
jgi:hypothetical protein